MEQNIQITTTGGRATMRAVTHTEKADYELRYTLLDGALTAVHATLSDPAGGERIGSLRYDAATGSYGVESFPYGGQGQIDAYVTDFATVVAALAVQLSGAEADGTDEGSGAEAAAG